MQIIESTVYGVRSAIYHLEPRSEGPDIVLYPMIHLGERGFYHEIGRRLAECDLVLCEGVRSSSGWVFTLPYRMAAKNPRLNLVTQHALNLKDMKGKVLHADVSGRAFDERLRVVPLLKRLFLFVFSPIAAFYCRFFLTRRLIAAGMSLTLRKSRDELLSEYDEDPWKNVDPWKEIIIDWRDAHLIGLLEAYRKKPEFTERTIGILYGARHMRAVIKYLMIQHNYRVARSEWVMVFSH